MNKKTLKYLCFGGLLIGQSAFAEIGTLEDFSNSISLDKFNTSENVIDLDTANQQLILSSGGSTTLHTDAGNRLHLNDSNITLLQADLSVLELTFGDSATQQALIHIAGVFYNSNSATASTSLGEVFVDIALGDRGNGLEAWYEIVESTADDWSAYNTIAQGSLGSVALNTSYPVSVSYDGDKTFSFTFNNGSVVTGNGPDRAGAPYSNRKNVRTTVRFGQDNSTPGDLSDVTTSDGSAATITGTVDNVTTENGLVDAFSAANIDQSIWSSDEISVKVVNEKLELIAKSNDTSTHRNSVSLSDPEINFLGATATLLSSSTQTDTARVIARIGGNWYNDTLNENTAANGSEGEIWSAFNIERRNGAVRATVSAWRCADVDCSNGADVFWHRVGDNDGINITIAMDTAYDISIEKTSSSLVYRIDEQIVYTHNITTPIYPSKDNYKMVRAEIRDDVGEAHARFDDITTDGFDDPVEEKDSSGGGSFNPFLPLVLWLVFMGIMRKSCKE